MILGDVFSSKLSQLLSYFRFALAKHGTEAEWNWLSLQWSSQMNSLLGEARSILQSRGKLARAWEAVTAALLRALASSISELGEALWLLLQCQGKLRQDERHPKGEATLPNMREFLHFSSLTQRAPQKHHERRGVGWAPSTAHWISREPQELQLCWELLDLGSFPEELQHPA